MKHLVNRFWHKYSVEIVAVIVAVIVTVAIFNLGYTEIIQ